MKFASLVVIWSAVFCCSLHSAHAANRFDVVMEGPWILYQDANIISGQNTLVAMAPGINGPYAHKDPYLSTGDGIPFSSTGTFCIGFDGACKLTPFSSSLTSDGYGSGQLLTLEMKQPWSSNRKALNTYILLPIPTSYSNDGTYTMRFGPKFGQYTTGDSTHSIGIVLHYDTGPAQFNLLMCSKIAPVTCTDNKGTLDNSGTLQIMMKAPDNVDACDLHVRAAYPQMVYLLDPTLLSPTNQKVRVIDIPYGKDDTGALVYNQACYDCDAQNPNQSNCTQLAANYHTMNLDISEQLVAITDTLDRVHAKSDGLQIKEMQSWSKPLAGRFAKFSELHTISKILHSSMNSLSNLVLTTKDSQIEPKDKHIEQRADASILDALRSTLERENRLAAFIEFLDATKTGNDCRAPTILAQ
ncbi:MAG TPA: hypothetical protein VGH51_19040 [Candidatus Angelobacter sp.]|jgi:hypothetical protein